MKQRIRDILTLLPHGEESSDSESMSMQCRSLPFQSNRVSLARFE
ncbi:hypothetical protein GEOBRER4_n3740 [Citrifermentans bremense]|uniref:Uncharacterized protein n=1 Tax=Citrifermentans bremense TaxID=60035 RepID=A0A7R7J0E9_9BACT|nr:hypothetical protein GEOBRER4_n3740 [Citrifermentans bremense]